MRRSRVVFLWGFSTSTELFRSNLEIVRPLVRRGWRIHLIGSGPKGSPRLTEPGASATTVWAPALPIVGAVVANILAVPHVLKSRPHVIYVGTGFAIAGALCALLDRRAIIVSDVRSIPVDRGSRGVRVRLNDFMTSLTCKLPRLRGLTANTTGQIEALRHGFGLDPAVPVGIWSSAANVELFHPDVVPVSRASFGIANDASVFVYHGVMTVDRGLLTLVEAFAQVHAQEPATSLLLLGGGPAVFALRERVAALGITGSVVFVPPVRRQLVPAYLAAADIGVIPLPDLLEWRISSPLKMFEYLSAGRSIIASDLPSIAEILVDEENCLLVDPDSVEQWSTALGRLEHDAGLRVRLARGAVETAGRHTIVGRVGRMLQQVGTAG